MSKTPYSEVEEMRLKAIEDCTEFSTYTCKIIFNFSREIRRFGLAQYSDKIPGYRRATLEDVKKYFRFFLYDIVHCNGIEFLNSFKVDN